MKTSFDPCRHVSHVLLQQHEETRDAARLDDKLGAKGGEKGNVSINKDLNGPPGWF
jgi:hypothetical protein